MPDIKLLNPTTLGKPLGPYSHVARVKASEFLFIAGQVGAGPDGKAEADFDALRFADAPPHPTSLRSVDLSPQAGRGGNGRYSKPSTMRRSRTAPSPSALSAA